VSCRAISKRVFLEVHMTHPAGASGLQLVDSLGRNLSRVNLHWCRNRLISLMNRSPHPSSTSVNTLCCPSLQALKRFPATSSLIPKFFSRSYKVSLERKASALHMLTIGLTVIAGLSSRWIVSLCVCVCGENRAPGNSFQELQICRRVIVWGVLPD